MIPALLYELITITNGQMSIKTGLTEDECRRAASYAVGNACIRYPNGPGTTLVLQINGKFYGVDFRNEPEVCQKLLESTTLPAGCLPIPMPIQGCLS